MTDRVSKPRLLDACCCAGGATKGYQRAGFHVTGVDIDPQPNYCGDEFVQADAVQFIRDHGHEFDAIHASFPCQASSALTKGNRGRGWTDNLAVYGDGGGKGSITDWQQAMGIDWTDVRRELSEAIPPAYTEFVGEQLLAHLSRAAA